ncbi:C4-dicarboxylic acid transporter DauA [Gilvimarinus sp. SDUM040013]|uniref:C4-dicarboxylic acid transporter DauA n=1 Tax=Gilvimarinus gilvus TaxID=3058038 RepID=A0ABU4RVP6_9GAMM|nr:C4-dicarboxylic acid transporter DauA [Gilvimarinus sp. SDUM040013]MDO3386794.1 C4-dicarboxylic acid transporter DauA [Gilvimarinus sp. SDUM040013]MDX6848276.1 C4-dicarboxylic acid transporter DauA [Gilvimarinus sp. SDUM040013]
MPARRKLEGLQLASALRDSLGGEGYGVDKLRGDLLAGLTVGISAIPLSMALAIAIGIPPEHGLYTSLVAGLIMALFGGSRYSISGPTAAFVVILQPIVQQYGLSGLLLTTLMSACIALIMAVAKFGRIVTYIPNTVTFGFTVGIAVIIATLQLPDLLGLQLTEPLPDFFFAKIWTILAAVGSLDWPSLLITVLSFSVMLAWPKLKVPVPAHLVTIIVATAAVFALRESGVVVATIGSSFEYTAPDGGAGAGIPNFLPAFELPWHNSSGAPWTLELVSTLLPEALTIALLGAIEALLCAVMLERLTGARYHANAELFGHGLGNLIAPFFGGFSAAPELARSTTNYRAGARTPIAAIVHAGVIAATLIWAEPYLQHLPMACMATLVIIVAWRMCHGRQILSTIRTAPMADVLVFFVCFSLTLMVDMVVAIGSAVVIAAFLFMRDIAEMTKVRDITKLLKHVPRPLPDGWRVVKISGPMFFAAADKIFNELEDMAENQNGLVLHMDGVPLLDAGGLDGLTSFIKRCKKLGVELILSDIQFQPLRAMVKAEIKPENGNFVVYATLADALDAVLDKSSEVPPTC